MAKQIELRIKIGHGGNENSCYLEQRGKGTKLEVFCGCISMPISRVKGLRYTDVVGGYRIKKRFTKKQFEEMQKAILLMAEPFQKLYRSINRKKKRG